VSAEKILLVKKHPLSVRWTHWINFPLLTVMVWSGLCIYWANPEYGMPQEWLDALGLQFKLAEGLSWHWPFAFIFTVNGILYSIFLLSTRHWRFLFPNPADFKDALLVAAHDFHLLKQAPATNGKYNAAQKLAYFFVFLFGVLMVGTGFAIYKPTQLNWLLKLFGGYTVARYIHFYITIAFILFFCIHIAQVIRAGWNNFRAMVTGLEKK
jgi:thiosulfate reductase cytochrome b subunit